MARSRSLDSERGLGRSATLAQDVRHRGFAGTHSGGLGHVGAEMIEADVDGRSAADPSRDLVANKRGLG
jgi:hypothetical protein